MFLYQGVRCIHGSGIMEKFELYYIYILRCIWSAPSHTYVRALLNAKIKSDTYPFRETTLRDMWKIVSLDGH